LCTERKKDNSTKKRNNNTEMSKKTDRILFTHVLDDDSSSEDFLNSTTTVRIPFPSKADEDSDSENSFCPEESDSEEEIQLAKRFAEREERAKSTLHFRADEVATAETTDEARAQPVRTYWADRAGPMLEHAKPPNRRLFSTPSPPKSTAISAPRVRPAKRSASSVPLQRQVKRSVLFSKGARSGLELARTIIADKSSSLLMQRSAAEMMAYLLRNQK
jgi:hypothetical protein